jgi:N-acetylmuramic acid 6-phosphate etherase
MGLTKSRKQNHLYLGIEGGATRTLALLVDENNRVVKRLEAGPANLKLLTDAQLVKHFRGLASALPSPCAIAAGLAGAWQEGDWERMSKAAAAAWPGIPFHATNDLETAIAASSPLPGAAALPVILVLSGTGSCCYGRYGSQPRIKVGGWGHMLGDKGSAYEIGLRALKATLFYYDQDGEWPSLGEKLLAALQLQDPYDLIAWAHSATKAEVARLALEVFKGWERNDKIAADILIAAASSLARDAVTCARKLVNPKRPARFVLAGSTLLKQPRFAANVTRRLKKLWPEALVTPLDKESVWGAVDLARGLNKSKKSASSGFAREMRRSNPMPIYSRQLSPTELRNPRSMKLDRLSLPGAIELMLKEESFVPKKLLSVRSEIEKTIVAITRAFQKGGRLFYLGAGTSGRLGVLDASECPPTFRTPPELVQGIIAGGDIALRTSVEGAEDDSLAGAKAIGFRGVSSKDVVVGIAASGTTPYVWGALAEAKKRRATTVLVCFNPFLEIPKSWMPKIVIAPDLGPEILTGSTRLKSGTATKLLLNIFTTLAMVKYGKVMSNLMVDLNPVNRKLRDRAARIVQDLTQIDYPSAWEALEKESWVIKKAVSRLNR